MKRNLAGSKSVCKSSPTEQCQECVIIPNVWLDLCSEISCRKRPCKCSYLKKIQCSSMKAYLWCRFHLETYSLAFPCLAISVLRNESLGNVLFQKDFQDFYIPLEAKAMKGLLMRFRHFKCSQLLNDDPYGLSGFESLNSRCLFRGRIIKTYSLFLYFLKHLLMVTVKNTRQTRWPSALGLSFEVEIET